MSADRLQALILSMARIIPPLVGLASRGLAAYGPDVTIAAYVRQPRWSVALTMSLYILIAKIILVAFFLFMFLRNSKLAWGVGLLTVTTAILLDTLFSTFSREEMLSQFGFFFYVIVGALVGGAAFWLWALLAPRARSKEATDHQSEAVATVQRFEVMETQPAKVAGLETAFDRQMLQRQMRDRLSPDELLDVVFDLGWSQNEIVSFGQENSQLIDQMIERAVQHGQIGDLTLAVERVLTPIPKENLPRLEKLSAGSPPTIIRHYLLAHCDQATLQKLASGLRIDWEALGGDNKNTKTRNLLLHLKGRGLLPEFINLLKSERKSDG